MAWQSWTERQTSAYRRGLLDHQKAVNALKDMGYDKTITLEVFTTNSSNDAKSSADKLRTVWSA